MSTVSQSPSPEALVHRLVAEETLERQRSLIAGAGLDREGAREAARLLVDEAERLTNVDPVRMERACISAQELALLAADDYQWAMARFRQGEAVNAQGRNAEARAVMDEAAAVFTRLGRPVEAARTRIVWALATNRLGDDREALAAVRAARRVLVAHGATLRVAALDLNVGIIHAERGRFRTAVRLYGSALTFFGSIGDSGGRAM